MHSKRNCIFNNLVEILFGVNCEFNVNSTLKWEILSIRAGPARVQLAAAVSVLLFELGETPALQVITIRTGRTPALRVIALRVGEYSCFTSRLPGSKNRTSIHRGFNCIFEDTQSQPTFYVCARNPQSQIIKLLAREIGKVKKTDLCKTPPKSNSKIVSTRNP